MAWNDDLKPPHRDVAAYPDSPLRVLAVPGTGKTFAIMRRVSRLLEEGENPKDILLVTFTRMAAKDLVGKIWLCGISRDSQSSLNQYITSYILNGRSSLALTRR